MVPCILSGWDNTSRYNERGVVIQGDIEDLIEGQINEIKKLKIKHDFILVKAFNEWAEGNILEPYKLNYKKYYPYKKIKDFKS